MFGPVFLDGTIKSGVYLSVIKDSFVTFLHGYDIDVEDGCFQRDSGRSHTAGVIPEFLDEIFDSGAI
jgi:hypothetical protein